ncbi:hypothetical protein [Dactylosporangium sp. NPDC000521]|uniref:hypothetical protein n=1 Tax=Dactylosporangium sp. NPDC000521 TaxID=3363975 RepID=UPI0036CB8163
MGGAAPAGVAVLPEGTEAGHRRGPGPGDRFSLGRLLTCDNCDQLLRPSWDLSGERQYIFLCGCRRGGINADVVERLVYQRVEAESVLLVADVAVEALPAVFQGIFAAVRIGHSTEDLMFVWRI